MRRFARLILGTLGLFLFAAVAMAVTTYLAVTPTNLQGWQLQTTPDGTPTATPAVVFVDGPGAPPLGTGSVELRVGSDGDSFAQIRHPGYAGTILPNPAGGAPAANELSAFSYSTYVQNAGTGPQAPFLILQIDTDGDAGIEDFLFFEPAYQNGSYPTVDPSLTIPNQCGANSACVTPGQWQTWDALNGGWYSLNAATFGPPLTTLKFYRSQNPTARIANASPSGLGGIRVLVGSAAPGWDNFVGNIDNLRIGVGANDTLYNFDAQGSLPVAGQLLISEVRTSGPGGAGDDYVEIYNNSDSPHTVSPPDGSDGYGVFATNDGCGSNAVFVGLIPFGAVIPPRGHYLLVGSAYSLANYGGTGAANGDRPLAADLAADANVGLFFSSNPANVNAGTRLGAVGFGSNTTGSCNLLREGTTLPAANGSTSEYAFVRHYQLGAIVDTVNNATDFLLVSTTPATPVGNNASPILGAPAPENSANPVEGAPCGTITFGRALLDASKSAAQAPNRVRDAAVGPNAANGTLSFRRRFTNNTGQTITRLRFRIYDLTTAPTAAGTADLRSLTSSDQVIAGIVDAETCQAEPGSPAAPCAVMVGGTTVEMPPAQPDGGAINSTVTANLPGGGLANGKSINLNFAFGVQQTGSYQIEVILEALPVAGRQAIWVLRGHTETGGDEERGCANAAPVVDTNTGITAIVSTTVTIDNTKLKLTDADNDPVTFRLTSAPTKGTLKLNNVALAVNDTFTQADIDASRLTDTAGSTLGADSFNFTASDEFGGSVSGTFNITVAAAPTITTQASAGITIGGTISDTATLAGGSAPTGTITFRLYGPDDASCGNAPVFTSSRPVTGNGDYVSESFTPASAGTYRWIASYEGDSNNLAVSGACNDANESVVVSPLPSPSPSPSPSPAPSPSPSPSPSASPSPSPSPSASPSPSPSASPSPSPSPSGGKSLNISTRARVETEDRVLIAGAIITGNAPKRVIFRAIGPTLTGENISDALQDPVLELYGPNGSLITRNDDWRDSQQADIQASNLAPEDDRESAIIATLSPNAYTAIVTGRNGTSGVAVAEVYDLDRNADSALANISTRGFVQTGQSVMIGGFMLASGAGNSTVVIRALGPSLDQFGVTPRLSNPTLELRDSNGNLVRANDDWAQDPGSATITANGLAPDEPVESAIGITLSPGDYTAILAGKNNTTGIGLVEIYNLR